MDPTWKHPFTATVAGPTSCGKTVFTFRLIEHAKEMISPEPEKIIWCYGVYQDMFDRYPNIEFHEGVPNLSMFDGKLRTLLVLDDLMQETDDRVVQIFTKISHHKNLSVLYLTQNLFYKNKQSRTISLNSHFLIIFKNTRDITQIAILARQMYTGKYKFMVEAFNDATSGPYVYLVVDLRPQIDESLRLRTNIFPGETCYVYVRK